jgi:steroid delta-isomerase-like uncharacterized protein
MKESALVNLIEQWVDASNAKDMDHLQSLHSKDVIFYQGPSEVALKGWDYVRDRAQVFWTAFPDYRIKINDLHVDGNIVIMEFNATGTHTGQLLGYGPSGNKLDFDSCLVFRISRGKIVNYTTYVDMATVLHALGLIEIKGARPEAA